MQKGLNASFQQVEKITEECQDAIKKIRKRLMSTQIVINALVEQAASGLDEADRKLEAAKCAASSGGFPVPDEYYQEVARCLDKLQKAKNILNKFEKTRDDFELFLDTYNRKQQKLTDDYYEIVRKSSLFLEKYTNILWQSQQAMAGNGNGQSNAMASTASVSVAEGSAAKGEGTSANFSRDFGERLERSNRNAITYRDKMTPDNIEFLPMEKKSQFISPADIAVPDGVHEEGFWNHHGNDKNMYVRAGCQVPTVLKELQNGVPLEQLRGREDLRDAMNSFWSINDTIRVIKCGDTYVYDTGGRHRIAIAQELRLGDIPVEVVGELRNIN
jgi:hypothetical protein